MNRAGGRSTGRSRRRAPVLWMIIVGTACRLLVLRSPITYSLDAWRQADTASIAHNFLVHGMRISMPQINWGGAGPGYVETEFQLFTFATALLYKIFGEHVWIGRALSLSLSVGTMCLLSTLAHRLLARRAALLAVAAFVASPMFIRFSVAFMPEATMLFFYVGALVAFERWLRTRRVGWLYLTAVSTSLAVLTKPTAIHIGGVLLAWAIVSGRRDVLRSWHVAGAALVALLPVVAWFAHARSLYERYGNTFGVLSGGDSKFGNAKIWLSLEFYKGVAGQEVRWVVYSLAPVAVIGVYLAVRHRAPALVPVGFAVLIPYYFAVGRYAQDARGTQYHIYSSVYTALAVGVGGHWLRDVVRQRRLVRAAGAALVAVLLGGDVVVLDGLWHPTRAPLVCGSIIHDTVADNELVIVSSGSSAVENGVTNNFQNPVLFFHGRVYGWSLAAERHSTAEVEKLRAQGARWFIADAPDPLLGTDLLAYLATKRQVGPGLAGGCGIWMLG